MLIASIGRQKNIFLKILAGTACVFFLFILYRISISPEIYLGDFKIYYAAAKTYEAGLDPYIRTNLRAFYPTDINWNPLFIYPPVNLWFFKPLTYFSWNVGQMIWIAVYLASMSVLFIIWHRAFVPLYFGVLTTWTIILAFNATLIFGLVAGNVVIIEQALLWIGLAFLLKRNYLLFGICIALSAQFKLLPIAFLALLLVIEEKPKLKPFLQASLLFSLLFGLNFIFFPHLIRSFLSVVTTDVLYAPENVSILAFVSQVLAKIFWAFTGTSAHSARFSYAIYFLIAVLILGISYWVLRRYKSHSRDPRIISLFFCIVYCLTVPRLMSYSLITAIVPTLFLVRAYKAHVVFPAVLVLAFYGAVFPIVIGSFEMLKLYAPLLAVCFVWVEWCRMLLAEPEMDEIADDIIQGRQLQTSI